MSQVSHWCFTWHKTDKVPAWVAEKMRYLVYQVERCPETQRLHYQGYVEFNRSQRMSAVKKLLGDDAVHLEPRQGTRDQARAYCMKADSRVEGPWEFGQYVDGEQGKRSDLDAVAESIKEGKSMKEIVMTHTNASIRYLKGIDQVWRYVNEKPRDGTQQVRNIIIWGDAGVGKTRYLFEQFPDAYTSYMPGWWQQYESEPVAIYDDFDGKAHMEVSWFKRICDRYPIMLPSKGSATKYAATTNVFTSNVNPREWYDVVHWNAIRRRMAHIIEWREQFIQCNQCGGGCELVGHIQNWMANLNVE